MTRCLGTKPDNTGSMRASGRKSKLSFNEIRELETLPDKIAMLESEQTDIARQLGDPALYSMPPRELKALARRQAAIVEELDSAMSRWEALELRKAGTEDAGT